jgi:glycosyltransferase involved in cell wall biosynthesis
VDVARFDPEAVTPERIRAVRAGWGLADADPRAVILLPARLTFWKGHQTALAALAELPDLDAVLVFAGADRDGAAAALAARVNALGLADRVVLAGPCADMPAAYAASDLAITPSTLPEAFGRTAAEAQAMGVPVIAAAHGGALETVADGRTGFLVPPGNAQALARAIAQTLGLPDDARAAIGAAGRARVLQRFTAAALQAATLGVYEEALGLR